MFVSLISQEATGTLVQVNVPECFFCSSSASVIIHQYISEHSVKYWLWIGVRNKLDSWFGEAKQWIVDQNNDQTQRIRFILFYAVITPEPEPEQHREHLQDQGGLHGVVPAQVWLI